MEEKLNQEILKDIYEAILESLTGSMKPGRRSGGRVSCDGNPMAGGRWESGSAEVSGRSYGTVSVSGETYIFEAVLTGCVNWGWDESAGVSESCADFEEDFCWDISVCGSDGTEYNCDSLEDMLLRCDDITERLDRAERD